MKPPAEFLRGLGIGAGLIGVMAAISLFFRPGLLNAGQIQPAPTGNTAVGPRAAGQAPAPMPEDYLDILRNAGL